MNSHIYEKCSWMRQCCHIQKRFECHRPMRKISVVLWNCSSFFYHHETNVWPEHSGPISMEAEGQATQISKRFWLCPVAHGTTFIPKQGSNWCSLQWKLRVLTTSPLGSAQILFFIFWKGDGDLEWSTFNVVLQRSSTQNHCWDPE